MKSKLLVLLPAAAVALQFTPFCFAQAPDDKTPPKHGHGGPHDGPMANLSAEEREKLKAAHEKAMMDPEVKAAHEKKMEADKDFHEKMHAAMLKADPSIQPILDKMPKPEEHRHGGF